MGNVASYAVVRHHVDDGGCMDEFMKAISECNPGNELTGGQEGVAVDVEACVKATAALHRCFAGNPKMFKHQYLRRLEKGLDEDLKPSPEQVNRENRNEFRWWTGMRRG
jgi:hypothetical protein